MFTKLDLIERIIATSDEKVLERVGKVLGVERGSAQLSPEHLVMLEDRRARRARKEGKGYSLAEVKRMVKAKRK
jgi:hypothetical protein